MVTCAYSVIGEPPPAPVFRVWREVERGCLSVRQVLVGVFVASPVVHGFRCPAVERLLHAVGEFVEVFLPQVVASR